MSLNQQHLRKIQSFSGEVPLTPVTGSLSHPKLIPASGNHILALIEGRLGSTRTALGIG
jgi:hypothetical protein